jgi:hypothetical protein
MNWYRVTTHPESDPKKARFLNVVEEFSALLATKSYGSDVGMFTQSREFKHAEPFYFYFSPACKGYCSDLLKKYDAEEWPNLNKSEAAFLLGHRDARNLLD